MVGARTERRMAAVVMADVVGYSRLMAADEEGTLAAVGALRKELFEPTIASNGGRIVKRMGDGTLIEFPSAADAVRGSIEVQRAMAERNAEIPEDQCIELRIGVNLGDVIASEDDIFGDSVNVAARLEQVCAPGEVLISGTTYDHLDGKTGETCAPLGEIEVKNIPKPIRAYRALTPEQRATGAASAPPLAYALPQKPSIAVLPFENMSGDPDQVFFCDGLAEEIITALSRFRSLFVIARNTSFTFKGKAVDVKRVARDLGVQYVLEGSVRTGGNRVRVTAQLIDAVSDRHIWAERYDRELEDIFAIQDEITEQIAMAVAPELQAAEIERARRKSIPDLSVWELVARATWHIARYSAENNAEAQRLLLKALERDPDNVGALTTLSFSYLHDALYGWQRPIIETIEKQTEAAQRAVALDDRDERAQTALALVVTAYKHDLDEAIGRLESAIKLNPNYSVAIGWIGIGLAFRREYERSVELLHKAIRLSPRDPMIGWYVGHLAMNEFIAEHYEEARKLFEKAIRDTPDGWVGLYRGLASTRGMLGNLSEARAAYEEFNRRAPDTTIEQTMRVTPFTFPADAERYAEGLRRAGMPE